MTKSRGKLRAHWEPEEPQEQIWTCSCGNDMFRIVNPGSGDIIYLQCVEENCKNCYGIDIPNGDIWLL